MRRRRFARFSRLTPPPDDRRCWRPAVDSSGCPGESRPSPSRRRAPGRGSRDRRKPGPAATCARVRRSWRRPGIAARCARRPRRRAARRGRAGRRRAALDRRADVCAAHRHRRDSAARCHARRPTPTSTSSASLAWSSATGRSRRGAASSIRRRCSPTWAGRPTRRGCAAARARFHDLLALARATASRSRLHARRRRDRARSPFLEEIETAGLPIERLAGAARGQPDFAHEARRSREPGAATSARRRRGWRCAQSRRRRDARFQRPTGPRAPRDLRHQLSRALPGLPVQVLREPRPQAAGGAGRRVGADADRARALPPRRVRDLLPEWQRPRRRHHHDRERCRRAGALRGDRRAAARGRCPKPDRALERTHLLGSAAASGSCRARVRVRDRAGRQVVERLLEHELEGEFTFAGAAGPAAGADPRQSGPHRSDGRRDAPRHRLQAGQGAKSRARAAAADLRRVRAAGARRPPGPVVVGRRAGYVAFREKEPFVPLGGRAGSRRRSQRGSSACSTPSTASSAASFR